MYDEMKPNVNQLLVYAVCSLPPLSYTHIVISGSDGSNQEMVEMLEMWKQWK